MKIYTKIGDRGTTLLADGQTVSKTSLRVEAYGVVDELNAHLGLLRDLLEPHEIGHQRIRHLVSGTLTIQRELFDIGSRLANFQSKDLAAQEAWRERLITAVQRLESEMDDHATWLPPLTHFVLPGGHLGNSTAHVARTVCRRAERTVLELDAHESLEPQLKVYLNRLSDWLFIASRVVSYSFKAREILWTGA